MTGRSQVYCPGMRFQGISRGTGFEPMPPLILAVKSGRARAVKYNFLVLLNNSTHHHLLRSTAPSHQSTGNTRPPNGCISHRQRRRPSFQAHMEGVSREPVPGRKHGEEHSGLQQPVDEVGVPLFCYNRLMFSDLFSLDPCELRIRLQRLYTTPVKAHRFCFRLESQTALLNVLISAGDTRRQYEPLRPFFKLVVILPGVCSP